MSKKRRRHTKKKQLSTVVESELRSVFQREYPTDPRLIVAGLVLLLIGSVLYVLASTFAWSGWVGTAVNETDMILIVSGMMLIMVTGIARSRGN